MKGWGKVIKKRMASLILEDGEYLNIKTESIRSFTTISSTRIFCFVVLCFLFRCQKMVEEVVVTSIFGDLADLNFL